MHENQILQNGSFRCYTKIRDLEKGTDVSDVIEMKDYKETLSRTRDVIKKTAYAGRIRRVRDRKSAAYPLCNAAETHDI